MFCTTVPAMATATVQVPYADASPAELRAAILPEDREEFDEQYQAALDAARTTLRLDELEAFLVGWRRVAWLQADPERYRAMLARAEYINEHGHPPPGTKTYTAEESRTRVQRRLDELAGSHAS